MYELPLSFKLLQFCGAWRPYEWTDGWKKNLYNAYTIFAIFSVYTFTLTELLEIAIFVENFEDAVNIIFMALTMLGICYKTANTIFKRQEIIDLFEILNNPTCRPVEEKEIAIQTKYDKRCSINTLLFSGMVGVAIMAVTIGSVFGNIPHRTLPFKAWLPFDYTSELGYWIGYWHQIWSHALSATVASAHDTAFHGIMIQACSQLNILKARLYSIPEVVQKKSLIDIKMMEKQKIRTCVQHHLEICKFVERSNGIFNMVIFIQYSISTFVICVSTYMLSKVDFLSTGFTFLIVYLACIVIQIFLFCLYGNEVITESMDISNVIFNIDWGSLNQSTQKDLCLMMTRTHRRLKYTSGHVITLSLESYSSLMKFTYSIYNLLQQSLK